MSAAFFDMLLVALAGVQALGLTFGIAALLAVGVSTLLRSRTEAVSMLILADPIVKKPLLRAGLALTGVGLAAYAALTIMVRV